MRKFIKRRLIPDIALILVLFLSYNPLSGYLSLLIETGVIDKATILGKNIAYVISNDIEEVKAEDDNITVDIDVSGIIDAINEQGDKANGTLSDININGEQLVADTKALTDVVQSESDQLESQLSSWQSSLTSQIDKQSNAIINTIKAAQHQYRVANIYSINNTTAEIRWRPKYEELPYLEAIAYKNVGYAATYTGYWDSTYQTPNKPDGASREYEVLGYDANVAAEGYILTNNKTAGSYVVKYMSEDGITWSNAVQLIYKALGQYEYSYAYYTQPDTSLKPETSPLSQALSNVTTFDNSQGQFWYFVSRSNQITNKDSSNIKDIYWDRACAEGFVSSANQNKFITGSEFIKLVSNMMDVYQEQVISENEVNQLLQVYGYDYPIQRGVEFADAWAYLKVRGILNVDLGYDANVPLDDALNVAMCIADKDSRTDYKKIQISLNLGSDLVSDGYFPVKDLTFTHGTTSIKGTMDYSTANYYDYIIPMTDDITYRDIDGNILKTSPGIYKDSLDTAASGAEVSVITDKNNKNYYHIRALASCKDNLYIMYPQRGNQANSSFCINLNLGTAIYGGGYLPQYQLSPGQNGQPGIYAVLSQGKTSFDVQFGEDNSEWISYVDSTRSGNTNATAGLLPTNPTVFDRAVALFETWTTPMYVEANYDDYLATIRMAGASASEAGMSTQLQVSYSELTDNSAFKTSYPCKALDAAFSNGNWVKAAAEFGETGLINTFLMSCVNKGYITQEDFVSLSPKSYNFTLSNFNTKLSSSGLPNISEFNPNDFLGAYGTATVYTNGNTGAYKNTIEKLIPVLRTFSQLVSTHYATNFDYDPQEKTINVTYYSYNEQGLRDCIIGVLSPEDVANDPLMAEQSIFEDTSIANSAVMSRDENILIPYTDLVKCGILTDTFKGKMPYPEDDGVYYFQSKMGVIKVNDSAKTILIGTTFYNLMGDDGKGPVLIYPDNDGNEVYIDYRCVMGLCDVPVERQGTLAETSSNSVGSGSQVIYTLNDSGVRSSIFESTDFSTFNYADFKTSDANSAGDSLTTRIISSTIADGQTYKNAQNDSLDVTWAPEGNTLYRMSLSTFSPTANWMTVVRQTSDSDIKAGLFVWYPKAAFINNDYGSSTVETLYENAWKVDVDEALGNSTLNTLLKNVGLDNPTTYYDKMTQYAAIKLFQYTNGGFFLTQNWAMRYFDLTENCRLQSFNSYMLDDSSVLGNGLKLYNGNSVGACYWVNQLGFVYNIPSLSEFSAEKYYSGEYMLPLVYCPRNTEDVICSTPFIVNINTDYYDGSLPFGTVVSGAGKYNVFNLGGSSLGREATYSSLSNSEKASSVDVENITFAPAGCFAYFGGIEGEKITTDDLNQFLVQTNKVYIGTQRVYYQSGNRDGSDMALSRGTMDSNNTFILNSKYSEFYRVYDSSQYDVFVRWSDDLVANATNSVAQVTVSDLDLANIYLPGNLSLQDLLNRIESGTEFWILFCLRILPIIGMICIIILIGLSFLGDNPIIRKIFDKFFDPVYILTLGQRTIEQWRWQKVLWPCLLFFCGFTLILNGNLLKILAYLIRWWGAIRMLFH